MVAVFVNTGLCGRRGRSLVFDYAWAGLGPIVGMTFTNILRKNRQESSLKRMNHGHSLSPIVEILGKLGHQIGPMGVRGYDSDLVKNRIDTADRRRVQCHEIPFTIEALGISGVIGDLKNPARQSQRVLFVAMIAGVKI